MPPGRKAHQGSRASPRLFARAFLFSALFHCLSPAAGAERLHLQLKWFHQFQFAGYYAAQARGFYRDEGLEVEITEGAPDRPPDRLVLEGKVDFGVHDGGELVYQRLHGAPLVALAAVFQHSPYVIISRSFRHPSDLLGMTIPITQDQGSAQILAMLRREGIRVSSVFDEAPVHFVRHSWSLDPFVEGKVQASAAYLTELPRFRRLHRFAPAVMNPLDYGIDFYGDTLFTSEKTLRDRPELVERFRRASLRGWAHAMAHPEEVAALIQALPTARQPPPALQDLLDEATALDAIVLPRLVEIGNMNPGRWERMAEVYRELGMVPPGARLGEFMLSTDEEKNRTQQNLKLLGIVLGAVTSLALLSLAWVRLLRTQVQARTRELAADVAERKVAERQLRESEAKLRGLFELSRVGIVLTDTQGHYIDFNAAFERICGYTREELARLDYWKLTPKEYAEHEAVQLESLRTKGFYGPYEKEYIRKDGTRIPLQLTGVLIQGANQASYIWSIVEDISERKRHEARMQLSSRVFESTLEGIMITDGNLRIVEVNDAFTSITGYGRDEALGHTPALLQSGHHGPEFYARMWDSIKTHGHWVGEVWNRRKDGEVYTEKLTISVLKDPAGKVVSYVGVFSDISQLKQHEKQLERTAHYDALTGIPNRVLLADRMRQALAHAQRSRNMLAVCYLDLDGFKQINDSHGHAVGDRILIEVARRIQGEIRADDTVARLGGDEFVILLLDVAHADACHGRLGSLLEAIARPISIDGRAFVLSASIGVTLHAAEGDEDADALLRHADQAMYTAKQQGKNRYVVYDAERDQRVRAQQVLQEQVAQGLAQGEFELFYQPKVQLATRALVGAEALIRWRHPQRGLLSPGEFLPALENTELDIRLGEWVIDAAARQLARWQTQRPELAVSINISAFHLQSEGFASRLRRALEQHGLAASHQLQIEILETAALEDMQKVTELIEECRSFGVRFALDDFGTGYSSLTYLSYLPVDTLKIDQFFIRDMLEDQSDRTIVQGVIALAKAFGREIVAEGVESEAVYQLLLQMGCEIGQGYGIGRPMPVDALERWVFK